MNEKVKFIYSRGDSIAFEQRINEFLKSRGMDDQITQRIIKVFQTEIDGANSHEYFCWIFWV